MIILITKLHDYVILNISNIIIMHV